MWCSPATGKKYERAKTATFKDLDAPLFWVRLSSEVGQVSTTDRFTCEADLKKMSKAMSLRDVEITKKKWGPYPLLIWTGKRPDGSSFHSMWIGLNTPDGWTILVDYRMPQKAEGGGAVYEQVWRDFVDGTSEITNASHVMMAPLPAIAQANQMEQRLSQVVISEIELRDANPLDVIDYLVEPSEPDSKAPIRLSMSANLYSSNLVTKALSPGSREEWVKRIPPLTLTLTNVSLLEAIREITTKAKLTYEITTNSVLIKTKDGQLLNRRQ